MALTATANEKVVSDAIRVLGMRDAYLYRSSFNRPNLAYEVRKKDGKSIDVMADYIAARRNESGVIYCLSRKDCETVSDKLQAKLREKRCGSVTVSYYHAELDPFDRKQRHHAWSSGKISVLCATIAFGMGIDKPDVRYVIHFSMPKSITHYYQESGRAGRDGGKADCILFYAYKDKKVLEMMIRKSSTNPYSVETKRKIDQLYSCLRYCQNEFLCRRTMQLEFFGEKFDRANCNKTCDNCRAGKIVEKRDLTNLGKTILRLLQDVQMQKNGRGVTLPNLTDLLKGSKSKAATKFLNTSKLSGYGAGSKYTKVDLDRIMHSMVFQGIVVEIAEENGSGFSSDYVKEGEKAPVLERGQMRFIVEFAKTPPRQVKEGNTKENNGESVTKSSVKTKKNAANKSKSSGAATKAAGGKKKSNSSRQNATYVPDIDDFEVAEGNEDDLGRAAFDDTYDRKVGMKSKSPPDKTVLPKGNTERLIERIKKLVSMWADEERMSGNNVFCAYPPFFKPCSLTFPMTHGSM